MKTKNSLLFFAGLFALLLVASVSADNFTMQTVNIPASVAQDADSFDIDFSVTYEGVGSTTFNLTDSLITGGSASIAFDQGPTNIAINENETVNITATITFGTQNGPIAGTLTASNPQNTDTLDFSVTLTDTQEDWESDFCLYDDGFSDNPGDLDVKIDKVEVSTGWGDDESWFPLDQIEIEFAIENDGDDDIDNIQIEWGLWDTSGEEWIIDVDDEKDFDLKDGKDENLIITFTVDESDFDVDLDDLDDGDDYVLYVRGVGEVDNSDNDDTCDWDSETIEMVIEGDFVIATEFDFVSETVSCGLNLAFSSEIWNVGEDDQDEVEVRITSRNFDYQRIFQMGDIDAFDNQKLDLTIPIPRNLGEGTYSLEFEVYDEDDDIYENDFDDDESRTAVSFTVSGGCSDSETPQEGSVLVSANLASGGVAGQELVINAMITNTGSESQSFRFNAAGFNEWASTATLSRDTALVAAGDAAEITIVFDVNEDAQGDNVFRLEVVSDDELVASQPVSVTIQRGASGIGDVFGDNWYLYLVVALNVILIIIIIVVATRISGRKRQSPPAK